MHKYIDKQQEEQMRKLKLMVFYWVSLIILPTISHGMEVKLPQEQKSIPAIGDLMFILSQNENTIHVMNSNTLENVCDDIQILSPNQAIFNPNGSLLYVFNNRIENHTGTIIDTRTLKAKEFDKGKDHIAGGAFNADGSLLFLLNYDKANVLVFNTETLEKIKDIPVGNNPIKAIVSSDGAHLYVLNISDYFVSVINTKTLEKIKDIKVGSGPINAVFNTDGSRLYITNTNGKVGSISVIDTNTLERIGDNIDVGEEPKPKPVFNLDGSLLFVLNYVNNFVSVIDTNTLQNIKNIPVVINSTSAVLNADGSRLYVATSFRGFISIIDTNTLENITYINFEDHPPSKIFYSADHNHLVMMGHEFVSLLDPTTLKITKNIPTEIYYPSVAIYKPQPYKTPELIELINATVDTLKTAPSIINSPEQMKVRSQKITDLLCQLRESHANEIDLQKIMVNVWYLLDMMKQEPNDHVVALENFFHGVQLRLQNLKDPIITHQEDFDKVYEDIGNFYLLKKENPTNLKMLREHLVDILDNYADLTEVEKKVLTFIGLQTCSGFLTILEDQAKSQEERLDLLNFIDGYELGNPFDIPLPGMEEDSRSTHDFLTFVKKHRK